MVRVLGIDPGSRHLGWAVIDVGDRGNVRLLEAGFLKTKAASIADRLAEVCAHIQRVRADHDIDQVALEALFFNRNVSSAIRVGEARGAVLVACSGLPHADYTPQQVKKRVAADGKADKKAVQDAIAATLGLADPIRNEHEADACAIAICHAVMLGLLEDASAAEKAAAATAGAGRVPPSGARPTVRRPRARRRASR